MVDDTFVCIYGDSVFNFDLKKMIAYHKAKKSFITMSLYKYTTTIKYGVIDTAKSGKVTAWNEKPEIHANINIGCYVMEPQVFGYIPADKPYGMDDVIKKALARKKEVNSFIIKSGFIDIGDKISYKKAYEEFREKLGKI
jgi:mannose-1-phosphate guanylyltransferase